MLWVIVSWLIVGVCMWVGFRSLTKLASLAPTRDDEVSVGTTEQQIAALNEQLTDVAYELERTAVLLPSLRRIVLLAGAALTVIQLAGELAWQEKLIRALLTFVPGLVGFGALLQIGREAKRRTESLRSSWNVLSRRLARRGESRL